MKKDNGSNAPLISVMESNIQKSENYYPGCDFGSGLRPPVFIAIISYIWVRKGFL